MRGISILLVIEVILPIDVNGRANTVEVMTHPSVKSDFGSGVLMVCSFGDQNDVSIFRELSLKPFVAIDLDGKLTKISGPLQGLKVLDARNKAIEILEKSGKMQSSNRRMQEIPVSERGGNPVEIILLKEWYVRQTHVTERLSEITDQCNFVPERNKQFLFDWMENISIDWPISRRRWYHTEVPIWYSEDASKVVVPPNGIYVQPWRDTPPKGSEVLDRVNREFIGLYDEIADSLGALSGETKYSIPGWTPQTLICMSSGYISNPDMFEKGISNGIEATKVKKLLEHGYIIPCSRVHYCSISLPLRSVWIDGLGMDPWGRKMSKSLGNGIDADSVLECGAGGRTGSWKIKGPEGKQVSLKANKIGSECFRLWKACDAQVGDDFHINPEEIESKYFGVLTKMFNIARLASHFEVPNSLESSPNDLGL